MSFWILCGFFVLLALGGGSSKVPTLSLLYLRPAAVLCIGVMAMIGAPRDLARYRGPLLILAGLALTIAMQLVPLPPGWAAALPGHARYAEAARLLGGEGVWHPISLTPDLTFNSLLALLPALVVLWAFASMRRGEQARTLWILPALALASMAFGILQLAQGPDSFAYLYAATSHNLPVGLLGNRNHQATLLAIAIPSFACVASLLVERYGRPSVFFGMAAAVSILCVLFALLTGSRSGFALVGVGALGAVAIAWPLIPRGRYRIATIVMLGIVLAAAIALAITMGRATAVSRLTAEAGLTGEMRIRTFPLLVQLMRDFAPFGSGFGGFDPVFRSVEPDTLLRQTFFNNAHNDFIELMMTGGLPAVAVLVVATIWFLHHGWQAWFTNGAAPAPALLARLGWLTLLMIALASLSDYPVRTPLFAAIAAMAAAWLCREKTDDVRDDV